jgi:hypothetical protein
MVKSAGTHHNVTQLTASIPTGDRSGYESSADISSSLLHPKLEMAPSVTSAQRAAVICVTFGGGLGAMVWRADFPQPGTLSGTANGIVIGVLMGTIFLAVAAAPMAYVIDLLLVRVEHRLRLVAIG